MKIPIAVFEFAPFVVAGLAIVGYYLFVSKPKRRVINDGAQMWTPYLGLSAFILALANLVKGAEHGLYLYAVVGIMVFGVGLSFVQFLRKPSTEYAKLASTISLCFAAGCGLALTIHIK